MTNTNSWATPTLTGPDADDVTGSIGDLTSKLWEELAVEGDEVAVVEWVDGSPVPLIEDGAYGMSSVDVFARDWPGVGRSEFLPLAEAAELLASL
jgi:hypothetical protein